MTGTGTGFETNTGTGTQTSTATATAPDINVERRACTHDRLPDEAARQDLFAIIAAFNDCAGSEANAASFIAAFDDHLTFLDGRPTKVEIAW